MLLRCVLTLVCAFGLFACKADREQKNDKLKIWMSENGKKKVLCTTAMVASLVERVGGDAIECLTLIQGEHDPHSYQLVKGDDEKFNRADLIFFSGLGLEHGPSLASRLEHGRNAYSLGDYILKTDPKSIIYIDTTIDPHVWMDVSLWSKTVPFIVETLSNVLPDCKDVIKKNANALIEEMTAQHLALQTELHAVPQEKRYLVTTHDAFNYFAYAYLAEKEELLNNAWRARFQAPEGLAPDSQLSTVDIHRLVEHIIRHDITCVFAESNVSRDSLKKLVDACRQKGYFVSIAENPLFADAIGPFAEPNAYLKMMEYDVRVMIEGFMKNAAERVEGAKVKKI